MRRSPRGCERTAACLLVWLALLGGGRRAQAQNLETPVKAAYLLNFSRYVEWPRGTFASAQEPVRICVYPDDPIADALERVVAGRTSQGRRVIAHRIDAPDELVGCHVVYVVPNGRDLPATLRRLAGRPVLTVGDGPAFLDVGGMLAFRRVGDNVRFDANQASAARAGLQLRSGLLDLAVRVLRDSSPGSTP